MSDITPKKGLICIYKEDAFKSPEASYGGTKLDSLIEAYTRQFDALDTAVDIPEPMRASEEYRRIGSGRDVAQIAELGYELGETTLDLRWMTGIFLYYAMGKCVTTEIDSGETITSHTSTPPSYDSGSNETTITLETEELSLLTWDGYYRLINDPDYTAEFTGNAEAQEEFQLNYRLPALTVTTFTQDPGGSPVVLTRVPLGLPAPVQGEYSLNDRTGVIIIGGTSVELIYELIFTGTSDDFMIKRCPSITTIVVEGDATTEFEEAAETLGIIHYLHTITAWETDDTDPFPSFGMHMEQAPGSDDLKVDMLGSMVRSITITIEKDAKCSISVDVISAYSKNVDAYVTTVPPEQTDEILRWADLHLVNTVWSYSGNAIIGTELYDFLQHTDSIEITIENDIDIGMVLAGEYPDKLMMGTRDYTIRMHVFPQTKLLKTMRNLKTPTDPNMYGKTGWLAGEINFTVEINREKVNSPDFIKMVFSKLRISDYPDSIPHWEEKILGVDVELKLAPGGSVIATVADDRNRSFYERT